MRTTLQNFLLPQLGEAGSEGLNLHQWIGSNRFSTAQLIGNQWHLQAYSEEELYSTFTPDFQRFSFSSFETFSLVRLENDHCASTSWPLLKLYYAAFFAAHAITRATGNGHVNLDKKVTKAVNDYLSIVGDTNEFSSGSYKASLKETEGSLCLILEPSNDGSGVHDSFWRYFCNFLDGLGTAAVTQALPSANSFLRETNALQSCIKDKSKAGVWFSATRNAINYRHDFDCWLPNSKKSKPRQLDFSSSLGDPDTMESLLHERSNDLVRLVNLSIYLASLNHQILLRIENDISGNTAFVRRWRKLKISMEN